MRQLIHIGFTIVVLAFFSGCSAFLNMGDAGPITGTWTGLNQHGSKVTMAFEEDHTMKMVVNTANGPIVTNGKFRIDYSGNPYNLSLYDLDLPGVYDEAEWYAVVSFAADDRMTYIGKYAVNGNDERTVLSDSPHMMHVELERIE